MDEGARRKRKERSRFVTYLHLGCVLSIAVSVLWFVIHILNGHWVIAASEVVLAVMMAPCYYLVRRGHVVQAFMGVQAVAGIYVVLFCLLVDVPDAGIPRATHLYLLVIALAGWTNYLHQPFRLQLALIGLCLMAFVILSAGVPMQPPVFPMAIEARRFGVWLNAFTAIAMLCSGVALLQAEVLRETARISMLRGALREQQFSLLYQPQVDLGGRITGAEALLRWTHPEKGIISPAAFIPDAEDAGIMGAIGGWVLTEACKTLSQWSQDPVLKGLTLAVNISASQFSETYFEAQLFEVVERYGVDPLKLQLELTEGVVLEDINAIIPRIASLRRHGFTIALDDFGTGYSSLSYLRRLPLDQLKIDRSFVLDSIESQRGADLARDIVRIGRDLDLEVLAEGIETEEQFAFMRQSGCSAFQGYLFGRPMTPEAFRSHCHQQASNFVA